MYSHVCLSFCLTHHHHHYRYPRVKIKGWSGLVPLPGSIEKHNLDKTWVARIGLFAYSGLGPCPRFQATTLLRKFQRCQVTVFSFYSRNQAKSSDRLGGKYRIVPSNQSSVVLTYYRVYSLNCAKLLWCSLEALWWNSPKINLHSLWLMHHLECLGDPVEVAGANRLESRVTSWCFRSGT